MSELRIPASKQASPASTFSSNFFKPHFQRKAKYNKDVKDKLLAKDLRDILLDRSDKQRMENTIKALQNVDTLGNVFKILHQMPCTEEEEINADIPDKKGEGTSHKKPQHPKKFAKAILVKSNRKKIPGSINKSPTIIVNGLKSKTRSRLPKKDSKGPHPSIIAMASRFEKKSSEVTLLGIDKGVSKLNLKNPVLPSNSIIDSNFITNSPNLNTYNLMSDYNTSEPISPCLIDSFDPESSLNNSNEELDLDSSSSTKSSLLETRSEVTLTSSSEPSLNGDPLKESHLLTDQYANQLKRRHAVVRRKSPRVPPSKDVSLLSPPFDYILPLELESHRSAFNPFKKYFKMKSPTPKAKVKPGQTYRHHLQRAYLPAQLIENIPIKDQVKVYFNDEEIEGYRKSGMKHLDLSKLSTTNSPTPPSQIRPEDQEALPGLASALHDMWFEDLAPPTDGVSAYIYWWGYEVYIPTKILDQLKKQGSTTTSIIAFITAIASSVPLLIPILKILSAFISMETSASDLFKSETGTVLIATWVLPFLVIPRAWN